MYDVGHDSHFSPIANVTHILATMPLMTVAVKTYFSLVLAHAYDINEVTEKQRFQSPK